MSRSDNKSSISVMFKTVLGPRGNVRCLWLMSTCNDDKSLQSNKSVVIPHRYVFVSSRKVSSKMVLNLMSYGWYLGLERGPPASLTGWDNIYIGQVDVYCRCSLPQSVCHCPPGDTTFLVRVSFHTNRLRESRARVVKCYDDVYDLE